jgi:hypothetical protein
MVIADSYDRSRDPAGTFVGAWQGLLRNLSDGQV